MFGLAKISVAAAVLVASTAAAGPSPGSHWVQQRSTPAAGAGAAAAAYAGALRAGALKPVEAVLQAPRGGLVKPPPGLYANAVDLGARKAAASPVDIVLLGILSGFHIGFGGLLAVTVGGSIPAIKSANPGLQKLLFGLFGLPFGLFMVLVAGGELFTGNTALVTAALVEGKATVANLVKNWTCSWAGNLLGSVLLAKLVVAAGINAAPGTAAAIAVSKVSSPFLPTFLKGIVCNWMVCMAVWVAAGATSLTEKYLAMILPVSAFVAFGAEHSVANMFLLPLGLFSGASKSVSWQDLFVKNILPVTLGNIVGGALCQTMPYAAVYGSLLK
ncbi:unnamed protein product [Ectocarpus sp. 4 AP-2014]